MSPLRIAYVNTYYQSNHTGGGHVHMGQFIAKATALGHEIWTYPNNQHPDAHTIPTSRWEHIRTMRRMDVLYVRLEHRFPSICRWALPPRRTLYGFPIVVWEFNTIPEEGLMHGEPEKHVQHTMDAFRRYGRGCDLGVCMTKTLGEHIQETLGIRRVLIIPNGSDPALFHPDAPIVKRMQPFADQFNVVWIGSAKLVHNDFSLLRRAAELIWIDDRNRNIKLHIIGPGLMSTIGDMPPNVYYWGAETYENIPRWLAAMDVGLSLYYPGPPDHATPLKVFDYMASELTVISTYNPFIKELFVDLGQPDLLVPHGDASTLAKAITGLAADRERVRRLGKAGRQLIIEKYNWRRSVVDTMTELESMLYERGRKPKG